MDWNNDNNKALIGTIIFHALLVLALLFLALRTPLPLPGEQGVEVSLGTSDVGMGTKPVAQKTPEKKQEVKPQPQKTTPPQPQKTELVKKEVITQNTQDAPALPKKQPKKKNKPKVETKKVIKKPVETPKKTEVKKAPPKKQPEVKKPQPVVNQRALFKMNKTQTGESSGLQPGTGNMGNPHGIEDSKNVEGKGGAGNGISYNLGGRGSAYLDKPSTNFNEQGTVVVKIWVDPLGNVIRAQVYAKGTTVVNAQLRNMALNAAKNSKFVADPTAPAQQTGTITYTFILKK